MRHGGVIQVSFQMHLIQFIRIPVFFSYLCQPFVHFPSYRSILPVFIHVVHFHRIFFKVIQLPFVNVIVKMYQLVTIGSDSILCFPVSTTARLGAQMELVTNPLLKIAPSFAIRSMLGV